MSPAQCTCAILLSGESIFLGPMHSPVARPVNSLENKRKALKACQKRNSPQPGRSPSLAMLLPSNFPSLYPPPLALMDAPHLRQSSSSGSSLTQRNGDTSYPPSSSKATLEQSSSAFEPALNSDAGRHPSSPPEGPPSRVQLYLERRLNSIELSHPRAYARLRKTLLYLRGPRPPTILPGTLSNPSSIDRVITRMIPQIQSHGLTLI